MSLIQLAEDLGFRFYGSLTWDRRRAPVSLAKVQRTEAANTESMGMGYDAGRNRKNDLLLFSAGERNGVLWDLGLPNVLTHKRLARRRGEHEAEKPVELFWDLARALTRAGDVVADFFVGRGRWIQKLLDEGRHVIAVDRNPEWVRAIARDSAQMRMPES